jgi:hypothetical protein
MDGTAQIINATVVGQTSNIYHASCPNSYSGIVNPRTENFQINGARFYNFYNRTQSAFGTCSFCFQPYFMDTGARTVTTSNLYFDPSVARRIIYGYPYRDIFYDTDGTLTGLGPNTFATYYYPHNDQPECTRNELVYNGLICNSSVQVRRILFYNMQPFWTFYGQTIRIIKWEKTTIANLSSYSPSKLPDYIKNNSLYSVIPYYSDAGWAVPFVTGHDYKVHWGYAPLDWTQL